MDLIIVFIIQSVSTADIVLYTVHIISAWLASWQAAKLVSQLAGLLLCSHSHGGQRAVSRLPEKAESMSGVLPCHCLLCLQIQILYATGVAVSI